MSLSFYRKFVGKMEQSKWLAFYIGGTAKKIVVDAGVNLERAMKYHPFKVDDQIGPENTMEAQLAKVGVKPEEIDIVILTHLHWDRVDMWKSSRTPYSFVPRRN